MHNKIYEKFKKFILANYKFILSILLIIILFTYELPYVVYSPGGLVNLDKRITVSEESKKDGTLNMSYVTLRKGNIPTILLSFIIKDWDLLKEEEVTSSDKSVDELLKLEKLYMQSSIDNATILAYNKANKKINITKTINHVIYILEEAKTDIKLYDEIISIDNKTIESIKELQEYIQTKKENDIVKIKVINNNKEYERWAQVIKVDDTLKIGISFLTTYEYSEEPSISIKTKDSESGSSGGLMLSLAIYNKISNVDLTKGRTVVGTGTIDLNGNVGKIDGIKYKLLGAKKNNADIFLCPKENYEEALKVKNKYNLKMKIYSVETFDEALNILKK